MHETLKRYFTEISRSMSISNWGLFLSSGVFAFWAASIGYKLGRGPQVYADFIVGGNTWLALSKQQDYLLLYCLVFGFMSTLLLLGTCQALTRRIVGEQAARDFHRVLVYACLPALIWLPGIVVTNRIDTTLLLLSAFLIALVVTLLAVLLLPGSCRFDEQSLFQVLGGSALFMVLMVCAGSIGVFILSRAGLWLDSASSFSTQGVANASCGAFLLAGLLIFIFLVRTSDSSQTLQRRLNRAIGLPYLFFPLGFVVVMPNIWDLDGVAGYAYPATIYAYLLPGVLVLTAYWDLYRCRRSISATTTINVFRGASPLCLVGLLLFLKLGLVGDPNVPTDSYHHGEFFAAWWSWYEFDLIPFRDFVPARGLLNYLPGALNQFLFDGTATSFVAVAPFVAALVSACCFPVIAMSIGMMPAFLGFLLMPLPDGVFSVHFALAAALCFCCRGVFRYQPITWLLTWIATGVFLVLFATGPGGLWVLATMPVGLWVFWQAFNKQRKLLFKCVIVSFATVVLLAVLTPMGAMVWGAIRYGLEQSSVNSVAHGLEWATNLGSSKLNLFLYETVRSSWIVVALVAGSLILSAPQLADPENRRRLLVYAVPIFILCVLFVMRAAGRIDAGGPSRLGQASIWALSLLLPVLLLAVKKSAVRRANIVAVFVLLSSFAANLYGTVPGENALFKSTAKITAPQIKDSKLVGFNGRELGMPNLGSGYINIYQRYYLLAVNQVLQRGLENGETFLDITGNSANYFYVDRRPPIESIAPYNLVHANQQLRSIETLTIDPPPLILASALNDLHDGGPLGLRSPLLYRFLITRYIPVTEGPFVWLVRPDRLARVTGSDERNPVQENNALRKAFSPANLMQIPISWGRSFESLKNRLTEVASLPLNEGRGITLSNRQFLSLDLSSHKLAGAAAGLLVFELDTDSEVPIDFTISWTAQGQSFLNENRGVPFKAGKGVNILPLDALPHWLLASRIENVRIAAAGIVSARELVIRRVRFAQRKDIELF